LLERRNAISGRALSRRIRLTPNSEVASAMTTTDNVYRQIEVVGSSKTSIEDAIETAIGRANATLRNVEWFEVLETRGHVVDGKVGHYQVSLKIGFRLDDASPM